MSTRQAVFAPGGKAAKRSVFTPYPLSREEKSYTKNF